MPQGRRKTPFSGKAKKEQLKARKQGKTNEHHGPGKKLHSSKVLVRGTDSDEESDQPFASVSVQRVNAQPKDKLGPKGRRADSNRYALEFFQETREEIQERKELAQREVQSLPESALEVAIEDFFTPELDFPKRPPWDFNMSREQLDSREQKYFREYVSKLESTFKRGDLSLFELNLETWRQLWRVLEMSDIVLVIVDVRYPALMFPPSLYRYVVDSMGKHMILILNKVDLAPAPLVVAWKHYFQQHFPNLCVLLFTSFPTYNLHGRTADKAGLQTRKRRGRLRMAAEGAQKLWEACKDIVKDEVDLALWQNKIREEMELDAQDDEEDELVIEETINVKNETGYVEHERYKGGVLTIGCVGQPNVGKSSLMNAVMGKKVVSVSRTPGHTKHFQTIYLTPNVRLCDCPGLVFPSKVPKPLQVIMGSYPIAQLREPYSVVMFVAERLDLVSLLRIQHPEDDTTWSAMDICDGWAMKRGFKTARSGRLDSYRGANSILRMTLDGKITLCLTPPGYTANKGLWKDHDEVAAVKWIQARLHESQGTNEAVALEESSEEDEDEGIAIARGGDGDGSSDGDEESGQEEEDDRKGIVNRFAALQ